MDGTIVFSRERLYELVWERPMSQLAAEYSVSDVALAKHCERRDIPRPPRGYWAKLRAGRSVRRPRLPPSGDDSEIRVHVRGYEREDGRPKKTIAEAVADAKKPGNRIVVPDHLRAPCELVRAAGAALKAVEPDDHGLLDPPENCLRILVTRKQLQRALRIADSLLKAFMARGWQVSVTRETTAVLVGDVSVAIEIEEELENVEVPTKPDLDGDYSFHYNRRQTVRKPSGHLTIRIRETHPFWGNNFRRRWKGSETRPLERRLDGVLVGILKLSSAVKNRLDEERREEAERLERERRRQAALEEQSHLRKALALESEKVEQLRAQSARWRESRDLRTFIEEIRERGCHPESGIRGQELVEWLEWASQQADRMDPFTTSLPSILDDAERIEHMCDDPGRHW